MHLRVFFLAFTNECASLRYWAVQNCNSTDHCNVPLYSEVPPAVGQTLKNLLPPPTEFKKRNVTVRYKIAWDFSCSAAMMQHITGKFSWKCSNDSNTSKELPPVCVSPSFANGMNGEELLCCNVLCLHLFRQFFWINLSAGLNEPEFLYVFWYFMFHFSLMSLQRPISYFQFLLKLQHFHSKFVCLCLG